MFVSIDQGKLPEAQTSLSAGYDVFSNEELEILPGERKLIKLGIKLDTSKFKTKDIKNLYLGLYLRSSLGNKKGMSIPNGMGLIDIDYKDEIMMILINLSKEKFVINRYDRLGQLVFQKHYGKKLLGDSFRKASLREGGLGSTGVK